MTSPDEQRLLELADRCEKATGPDRNLDAEIDMLVFGCIEDPPFTSSLDAASI